MPTNSFINELTPLIPVLVGFFLGFLPVVYLNKMNETLKKSGESLKYIANALEEHKTTKDELDVMFKDLKKQQKA